MNLKLKSICINSWLTIGLLLLSISMGWSQEIKPKGFFSRDSLKIGETVYYSLSLQYPKGLDIIFPDSTFNFQTFEYLNKYFYTTESDLETSKDSVIYELTTFEVDSIQSLSLPVFLVETGDSTALYANPDSIILDHVVKAMPDSLALIDNTIYTRVSENFNYPLWSVILTVIAIIIILVIVLFGKKIRKFFLLRSLKKSHRKFLTRFQSITHSYGLDKNNHRIEELILAWKGYLEKLENYPYTKLTTKEIIATYPNDSLKNSLRALDRSIYGHTHTNDLQKEFDHLLDFSKDRYQHKMEEVRYG